MKPEKTLRSVLDGSKNIRFDDMVRLSEAFGFELRRVSGSHHIFSHPDVVEILNLQNVNGKAVPYQLRQLLKLVDEYGLRLERDS